MFRHLLIWKEQCHVNVPTFLFTLFPYSLKKLKKQTNKQKHIYNDLECEMLIALSIWLCYWLLSFPISSATICCFSAKTCNILRTENMICFMKIWYALYVICILGIQWGHLPAYFNSELDCTFEVNLVTRGHHSLVHMIWECHALDEIRRNYIRCDVLHQGAYQGTQSFDMR